MEHRLEVGGLLHFGGAWTARPDDGPGDPTLLFGSAFAGYGQGAALSAGWAFLPRWSFQGEAGLSRWRTEGFARTDVYQRTLTLTQTTLDLHTAGRFRFALAGVPLYAQTGPALRVGLAARSTEIREGFQSEEPAPTVAVRPSMHWAVELGVRPDIGPVRLRFGVRWTENLTYPGTTRGRLVDFGSVQDPGPYRVDHDRSVVFVVGVDRGLNLPAP